MTGDQRFLSQEVLLVAGEPSGDRIAAGVARTLAAMGVPSVGMGGEACALAGVRLVADMRATAAMGFTEVLARLPAVLASYARLARAADETRPRAAVLVNYTEYNERLGRRLRRRGVPVLWCVAPQVWAWRRQRLRSVARSADRMAVILPFEEPLWRRRGSTHATSGTPLSTSLPAIGKRRGPGGSSLPIAKRSRFYPGADRTEVRRLAPRLLESMKELGRLGRRVEARVVVAPSLDASTDRWLRELAREARIAVLQVDPDAGAGEWLGGFDAALVASGTATLESALAGAPPVIVYRLSQLTAAIARRLVRTEHIGLPNVILGQRRYPELLQEDTEPRRVARELATVLDQRNDFEPLARELRRRLEPRPSPFATSAERIVAMMHDWLRRSSRKNAA